MKKKKLSVVPLTWTQNYTNLSAESIIFFYIKRWPVKVGFFYGKISVDPLCNASTDFNAPTLQRTLCPALGTGTFLAVNILSRAYGTVPLPVSHCSTLPLPYIGPLNIMN